MSLTLGASKIEARASLARERAALGSFNLHDARDKLTQMLGAIGATIEFSTYTRHDISHIDSLLEFSDWLIPPSTHEKLTIADALILTLSIYLHDLGMLVTREEFEARAQTTFPSFKTELLADDSDRGEDFRKRLSAFPDEDQEHFLYEEFVRTHHADRIYNWIKGSAQWKYGKAVVAAGIVNEVLKPLSRVIRDDIATIAKSHHDSDLEDLEKYLVNQAYGRESEDRANVQYAALILRTADLLHITSDRTPAIQFRLAGPSDPLGQREWAKQQAVRSVAPAESSNDQAFSVEVHASFEDPDGYFALNEYLTYCDEQLKQNLAWSEYAHTKEHRAIAYIYPWRSVDKKNVKALGFSPNHLMFTFDHRKVLDLLTGHTLYNDASVAVREILQNSIDAVRLERMISGPSSAVGNEPDIEVSFDSTTRALRVRDSGVGMSQRTIQDHFLKVGSSGYQTKEFKDSHPDFVSISRFGIGVLSAFMIADQVTARSKTRDQDAYKEVVLRSVHGQYLMRDLELGHEISERLGDHGTEVEMVLRSSALKNTSIESILTKWIVLPECNVTYVIDGRKTQTIGRKSAFEVLEDYLKLIEPDSSKVRAQCINMPGMEVAFAQRWNHYFNEWELMRLSEGARRGASRSEGQRSVELTPRGTLVQGIRVTSDVPGLTDQSTLILVNLHGEGVPMTNVARTDLEAGPELDRVIGRVYSSIVQSIENQINNMTTRVSKRFALREASYLYSQAFSPNEEFNGEPSNSILESPQIMVEQLSERRLHPTEVAAELSVHSLADLKVSGFWTLFGPAATDAARFLEWVPEKIGLLPLLQQGAVLDRMPDDGAPLLADVQAMFAYNRLLWEHFEPVDLQLLQGGASVLMRMAPISGTWISEKSYAIGTSRIRREARDQIDRGLRGDRSAYSIENSFCVSRALTFASLADFDGVEVGGVRMFLPHSVYSKLFRDLQDELGGDLESEGIDDLALLSLTCDVVSSWSDVASVSSRRIFETLSSLIEKHRKSLRHPDALLSILQSGHDRKIWSQNSALRRRQDD